MQISVNKQSKKAKTIGRDDTTGKLRMCGLTDTSADIQPMKTKGCSWNMKVTFEQNIADKKLTFPLRLRILAVSGQKKAKTLSFPPNLPARKVTTNSWRVGVNPGVLSSR